MVKLRYFTQWELKSISEVSLTTFEEMLLYPGLLLGFKLFEVFFILSSLRFSSPTGSFGVTSNAGQILFVIQELSRIIWTYSFVIRCFINIYNHSFRNIIFG